MTMCYAFSAGGIWLGFGNISSMKDNMCWTTLINTTGDSYSGVTEPTHTPDSILIDNIQFNTATGLFQATFGGSGADKIVDCNLVVLRYGGDSVDLQWNATELAYIGTNHTLAVEMAKGVGSKLCAHIDIVVVSQAILIDWEDENGELWLDENTNGWRLR